MRKREAAGEVRDSCLWSKVRQLHYVQAKAITNTTSNGSAGGNIRVGTVVQVQHGSISTCRECAMQHCNTATKHGGMVQA